MIQEALLQDIPGPFELEVSVNTRGEIRFTSVILLTLKFVLFVCLILYVPSTIFQLCRDGSFWVALVLS